MAFTCTVHRYYTAYQQVCETREKGGIGEKGWEMTGQSTTYQTQIVHSLYTVSIGKLGRAKRENGVDGKEWDVCRYNILATRLHFR
jgi:hypothetical protein